VEVFSQRAIGRPAPQGTPNLDRHQRDLAGRQDMTGGVAPPVQGTLGQRRPCAFADPRIAATAVEWYRSLGGVTASL
jgi:hypothetical protein